MMREAARRGHEIYAFEQRDMALEMGVVSAEVARIHLTGEPDAWYRADEARSTRAPVEFDAIIERKDPPFDMEYVYGTYLLELAESRARACSTGRRRSATTTKSWRSASSASSPRRPWSAPRKSACAPSTRSMAT
jgi:hypothetical protein